MKKRYIITILAIILLATVSCTYAAEQTIGNDYKFTVPDGYAVDFQDSDAIGLSNLSDQNYKITVCEEKEPMSESELVFVLQNYSFEVMEHQSMPYRGKNLIMVHYKDNDTQIYEYDVMINDTYEICVVYEYPAKDPETNWQNSPGKLILDSLTKK